MLPAKNRLRRRRDFQQLFRGGRVVRGRYVIARFTPTRSHELVGFVVSSTIFKNATDRNRLKRQLRGAVRQLGPVRGTHIILSATTAARHQPYSLLKHELATLFQQIQRPSPRR